LTDINIKIPVGLTAACIGRANPEIGRKEDNELAAERMRSSPPIGNLSRCARPATRASMRRRRRTIMTLFRTALNLWSDTVSAAADECVWAMDRLGICAASGSANASFGYFPPLVEAEKWFWFQHWPDRPSLPPVVKPMIVRPAAPDRCIVCNGTQLSNSGQPCWCCVERLCGPRLSPASKRCAHCGDSDNISGNLLLKIGVVDVGEYVWLHARCWADWQAEQTRKAPEFQASGDARQASRALP
jgi:hypothetical protein